jgi:hypothetical protein
MVDAGLFAELEDLGDGFGDLHCGWRGLLKIARTCGPVMAGVYFNIFA